MKYGALCAAAGIAGIAWLIGCGESTCSCAFAFVRIDVPAATASTVARSSVTGSGCEARCHDADFRPIEAGSTEACAIYTVTKTAPGTCRFAVEFKDGKTFARDVSFVEKGTADCCGGIYPAEDADIVVAAP